MHFYKVWSGNRLIKKFIMVKEKENVLKNLIIQASTKMKIKGCSIVLNEDGTEINDDEVLEVLKDHTFILLQPDESWKPEEEKMSQSETSTLTYSSDSSRVTLLSDYIAETNTIDNENTLGNDSLRMTFPNNFVTESNEFKKIDDSLKSKDDTSKSIFIVVPSSTENSLAPINEATWQAFQLPVDKIPKYMLEACEKGTSDRHITTEVIHIIVNEMRAIKMQIPSMAFRYIARQLADRYPKTFLDKDEDGTIIGNGTHNTVSRLQDRSNYLNRPHKRQNNQPPSPISRIKKMCNRRAGCSQWQPEEDQSETKDYSELKDILKNVNESHPNFFQYLEKTYSEQRKYINATSPNPPTAHEIKTEWPVLFRPAAILWHFKKLTHSQLPEEKELANKCKKLLAFGEKKGYRVNTQDEILIKAIEVLCQHFSEDIDAFLFKYKNIEPTNKDELEKITTLEPCIMEIDVHDHKEYYVLLEKIPLSETGETFQNAFQQCFALYFNFDLMYPKAVSMSLEFLQRYFYKIHPDSGTKSRI